jgi:hypothetical protein
MKLFQSPRILVYLRQIARELKRSNDLAEAGLQLEDPKWRVKVGVERTKMVEVVTPSVEDWNKVYREKHPMIEE